MRFSTDRFVGRYVEVLYKCKNSMIRGIGMKRKVAFRKKRQNRLGMICVTIVVAMLLVVMMFKSYELKGRYADYVKEEEALQAQIDAENERTKELEEYEKYTKTDKFVEEYAKEKLGLVYENEILFRSSVSGN